MNAVPRFCGFYARSIVARGAMAAMACLLANCGGSTPAAEKPPTPVVAQKAVVTSRGGSVSLTGELKARVQSDLSFRFAGRIAARKVDVGDHVDAGQILATLETKEQTADVSSAEAGVLSAEASLKTSNATFERQKALMTNGFTTQSSFDNAKQAVTAAEAALGGAKAALETAKDQFVNTSLRADAPGIVTGRNAEAGQVVEAAQTVFTVAQDGPRDAVFEIYESLLVRQPADKNVDVVLVSDPSIRSVGTVREIAPAVDAATGTVRVKVGIDNPPPQMRLGSAVIGIGRFQPETIVVLPWTAYARQDNGPAVWIVDPQSKVVSLKPVAVESYRTGELLLRGGIKDGDIVVTGGGQLLRPGQTVAPQLTEAKNSAGDAK